jgi:hypothetical protein
MSGSIRERRLAAGSLFLALLGLGLAGYVAFERFSFVHRAERTEGRVLDIVKRDSSRGANYHLKVLFRDGAHRSQTFENDAPLCIWRPRPGESVGVLYDPAGRHPPIVYSACSLLMPAAVPFTLGAVFLLLGLLVFLLDARQKIAARSPQEGASSHARG